MRIEIVEKKLFQDLIKHEFDKNIEYVDSFCIDSRKIRKGDVFLPLKGNRVDSHLFIDNVIAKGASLIFSENKIDKKNIINVNSTIDLLKSLSRKWFKKLNSSVIAITGSNGKTTTKQMITRIFQNLYSVNYTQNNYNSTIGLPICLFNFKQNCRVSIVEMGASGKGEIEYLCNIIQPNYSLITNIHDAHIGNFKSINELIDTKSQIFKGTSEDGIIFENVDDINISNLCKKLKNKVRYGFKDSNVDFFGSLRKEDKKTVFTINNQKIKNPFMNMTFAKNMLAAYSVASTYGIKHEEIIKVLNKFKPINGRGNIIYLNNIRIVNDSYNANLNSFKAGIEDFMNLDISEGRRILIIGDMKELGGLTKEYHQILAKFIDEKKPDFVFGFGDHIQITINGINSNKIHTGFYSNKELLLQELRKILVKGDLLYFKASRSIQLESIIEKL